jgi:hypothetical protein
MINTLDTSSLKTALRGIKTNLVEIVGLIEGGGKILPRMRYANDVGEWLKIAAIERVAGVQVIRCVFIYQAGWATSPAEGHNDLISPTYAIEVIQGFEDGTDEDNSTIRYEDFTADLIERFLKDRNLGFTEGTEVRHEGLQGTEGDGRPEYVDTVLAHRKVCTISPQFKFC